MPPFENYNSKGDPIHHVKTFQIPIHHVKTFQILCSDYVHDHRILAKLFA